MAVEEILKIDSIAKRFGVVEALKDVSFSINRSEIHTILGENGAGKSTLVKIIKGELKPDRGRLFFEGKEVTVIDPLYANSIGITMVHQELTIFKDLNVGENIFPNNIFKTKLGLINKKALLEQSRRQLALFHLDIEPSEKIANLSVAEQRIVEILRATALKRKLVILDEPTSGLNESDVRILLDLIKRLKSEGITIVYISHRIPEVLEISDRITILKDGNYVSTVEKESVSEADLIRLMVGHEVELLYSKKRQSTKIVEQAYFEVKDLGKENFVQHVSFELFKNEILGIYGLQGSGVEKLSQILFGLDSYDSGSIRIEGRDIKKHHPDQMMQHGFIYLSNNRKQAGLFFDMSSAENMACPVLDKVSKNKILKRKEIRRYTQRFVERFNIVIPDVKTKPKNLSGGNQQKLMFSICLGTSPRCVLLNEPTRGIDVGAKAEIHKFILGLPDEETSVIVFSSELPELMSLCDRIVVMKNNTVVEELTGDDIEEERIMALAAGS